MYLFLPKNTFYFVCLCFGLLLSVLPEASATHLRAGNLFVKSDTTANPNPLKRYFKLVTYSVAFGLEEETVKLDFGDCTTQTVTRAARYNVSNSTYNATIANVYYFEHTYSGTGTFTATYLSENRNAGIVNISNSVQQTFLLQTTFLVDPFVGNNKSPVFNTHPINIANKNQPFHHTLGAIDADGDSLSYKLIPTQIYGGTNACGAPIAQTAPGFRSLDQFIGAPADGSTPFFLLNPQTGLLTWNTPSTTGEYTVSILVEEWRNARLLGTVMRDMQIFVRDFPFAIQPNAGEDRVILVSESSTLGQAPNAAYEYQWAPSIGLSDPTIANPTVSFPNPQQVTYVLTTREKSTGYTSLDAVTVIAVIPNSPPVITLITGDTLLAGPVSWRYQWRKDGVVIQNITTAKMKALEKGTYSVRVQTGNGYSAWSPDFYFSPTITGLPDEIRQAISIFPNPAASNVLVQTEVPLKLKAASFYNSLGQYLGEVVPTKTSTGWLVNLQSMPEGLYFMHLASDKGSLVHKLIISR